MLVYCEIKKYCWLTDKFWLKPTDEHAVYVVHGKLAFSDGIVAINFEIAYRCVILTWERIPFAPQARSAYLKFGLFGFFFQPEQCFSLTTIQPEQCFSASFSQNSGSRTGPIEEHTLSKSEKSYHCANFF